MASVAGDVAGDDRDDFEVLRIGRLKKAGKDLTREGLIRGIESIHGLDLGLGPHLKLNYSSKEHKGFDHVLPTVIRGGRAVPFTDWSTAAPK
jgi:hypothetical protein